MLHELHLLWKARKFKKPTSPKLTTIPVYLKNPQGCQRELRGLPRSLLMHQQHTGVVIRDTHVMSLSKKKEKYKEVRKKSLRDINKTRPSGSGIVTKLAPSAAKIKPSVINEGTGAKPGVLDVTEESTESKVESWGRDEDDNINDHDSSSEGSDQESDSAESKVEDNAEGDEDKGMDYTTNQYDDDVDIRLNDPVNTDEGFIQKEGTNTEMINVQQGNENLEITLIKVLALEKEDSELKKDDLLNIYVTTLVDEHLDSRLGATRDEFMSYLSASITARIIKQVKI
ncbi:hypothetical protein Tco_1194660 [Tanacetum coccineum]